jgi:hypothetical protein
MFDAPRRRRRRRMIWPLLITIAVVIGLVVATAGGDARSTITYLEDVQTSATEISRAGSTLRTLVGDLSRVDRAEFQSVVGGVKSALDSAEAIVRDEVPNSEIVGAMTLYRLALDSWTEGIQGFEETILRAADEPLDDTVIDDLASAVVAVRAGDQIYGALIDEFDRDDVPAPVTAMPEIRLLPVDTPITVLAPAWVSAARSEGSELPIRPSVRIEQVSTDPEWVTSADGSTVVPAVSETIAVMVVIGNSGNTATSPGSLSMRFSASDGEPAEATEPVPVIEAGARTSIVFRDLAVVPGTFYQLELELDPGGDDTFTDDNTYSTGFTVNEATPDTTDTTDTTDGG